MLQMAVIKLSNFSVLKNVLVTYFSVMVTMHATLKEESFAISRFLAQFAKVCSHEMLVIYKSRKFILVKKIRGLDSRKSRNLKI